MKRLLFVLTVLLSSSFARAGGKLTIAPTYFFTEEKVAPKIGLSVYEKIIGPVFFNSWVGYGREYDAGDKTDWMVSKAGIDVYLPKGFVIGSGAGVEYNIESHKLQPSAYVSVSYKIW